MVFGEGGRRIGREGGPCGRRGHPAQAAGSLDARSAEIAGRTDPNSARPRPARQRNQDAALDRAFALVLEHLDGRLDVEGECARPTKGFPKSTETKRRNPNARRRILIRVGEHAHRVCHPGPRLELVDFSDASAHPLFLGTVPNPIGIATLRRRRRPGRSHREARMPPDGLAAPRLRRLDGARWASLPESRPPSYTVLPVHCDAARHRRSCRSGRRTGGRTTATSCVVSAVLGLPVLVLYLVRPPAALAAHGRGLCLLHRAARRALRDLGRCPAPRRPPRHPLMNTAFLAVGPSWPPWWAPPAPPCS